MKTTRLRRTHDASNFDDYVMIGLVSALFISLFAALVVL